jgi:hypothetical protein
MALCHNCDDTRTNKIGNGVQVDFTFNFTYNKTEDIDVAFWNEEVYAWEPMTTGWVLLNETTIRFDVAPDADHLFIIYRCTDLTPMPAEFYPGTPIKAQDLNDNFFVLQSAIEEARCAIARQDEKAEEKYWNKVGYKNGGDTVEIGDEFVCDDDHIATTGAICDEIESKLSDIRITEPENQAGDWVDGSSLDNDETVATAAALTDRYDPHFQDNLPQDPAWRMPGKPWINTDTIDTRVWDQQNKTWFFKEKAGPTGRTGPEGTYSTIVSDDPPTRRNDNSPLLNGDVWFNSNTAELFIWYDDGQPEGIRGKQWVQVGGGGGGNTNFPPGSIYEFVPPIVQDGSFVKFDLLLLNGI